MGRPRGRPRKTPVYAPKPIESIPMTEELPSDPPVEAVSVRPELRPEIREEDPRTRAARRVAELRDHGAVNDEGTDDFYIPMGEIPPGWTYEWKRNTVFGAEDPAYQVQLRRHGWEPVPAIRHPSFMPEGMTKGYIERKGMILMERPEEITNEARDRELRKARGQVRAKEEQLAIPGSSEFSRENNGESMVKVRKTYERMPVPE